MIINNENLVFKGNLNKPLNIIYGAATLSKNCEVFIDENNEHSFFIYLTHGDMELLQASLRPINPLSLITNELPVNNNELLKDNDSKNIIPQMG